MIAALIVGVALSIVTTSMNLAYGQEALYIKETSGGTTYVSEDGTNPIPIISKSMLPHFQVGEYAIMNFTIPFESIEEGDIIVFDCNEETDNNIMHRVIEVKEYEDGSTALETVGDYNDGEQFNCEKKISHEEYIGKIIQEESISYVEAFA
jgi:signal peptidase I